VAYFVKKKDGIAVKLNEEGRRFVAMVANAVLQADRDNEHAWHEALHARVAPALDADDPLVIASRQVTTDTTAELVLVTIQDERLTDVEAWAWLRTLQIGLRSVAAAEELEDDDDLEHAVDEVQGLVQNLQVLLWDLAKALS